MEFLLFLKSISDGILKSTSVEGLDLVGNCIGDDGVKYLMDCLVKYNNRSLKWLNLGGNLIGDDGAACISKYLMVNNTMTWLSLGNNKIGNKGAFSLRDSLKLMNNSLLVLDLSGNIIEKSILNEIELCLNKNILRYK